MTKAPRKDSPGDLSGRDVADAGVRAEVEVYPRA